jgi:hypothetical protein
VKQTRESPSESMAREPTRFASGTVHHRTPEPTVSLTVVGQHLASNPLRQQRRRAALVERSREPHQIPHAGRCGDGSSQSGAIEIDQTTIDRVVVFPDEDISHMEITVDSTGIMEAPKRVSESPGRRTNSGG